MSTDNNKLNPSDAILANLYELKQSKPEDYMINIVQFNRFCELLQYCKNLVQNCDCEIYKYAIAPQWIDGAIEVIFHKDIQIKTEELASLKNFCDGVNVDVSPIADDDEEWLEVTFFVKNMWKHCKD